MARFPPGRASLFAEESGESSACCRQFWSELSCMHNDTPHHSRLIVPLPTLSDPAGCFEAIDLFIESIVCGRSRAKGLILSGPIGAGKRLAALAAAAEFGTSVVELEPTSLASRDELLSLLGKVGGDGVLVIHNFDELPSKAQLDLSLLITTGLLLDRTNPYSEDACSSSTPTQPLPPRMLIATTNQITGMPPALVQALPCFSLRRSRGLIRSSLRRQLGCSQTTLDGRTIDQLVDLIYSSPSDFFDLVVTVLDGQAGRCEARHLDAAAGSHLVGLCWSAMSTGDLIEALQTIAAERGQAVANLIEIASDLGVPECLHDEVRRHADQTSHKLVGNVFERIAEHARRSPGDCHGEH